VLDVRALITGGSGFVGTWLVDHLRAVGDDVEVTDTEVDVTDPDAVHAAIEAARPEVVYHLAALSHVGRSWDDPLRVLEVNVLGTASVLLAARRSGLAPRVLVVSSAEVYGAVVDPAALPLTEDMAPAPVTPYAASKLAAEAVAIQAFRGHGQHVVVARPFNHVGPGQSPEFAVAAFAKRVVEAVASGQRAIAVGNLSARRDFTDVRDVVRAYRALVESGEPGTVYNVCSGRDVSMREVADELVALAGASLELEVDPALVRPVEVPVLRGDPGRLQRATGWVPVHPLAETLADVLKDWEGRASRAV
jgi:GDP-4-dehydro-6-deoxy-D-mannose reductase